MPALEEADVYKPHEARIHGSVFDTLSRPLLSRSDEDDDWASANASSRGSSPAHSKRHKSSSSKRDGRAHITWDHFGQKHHVHVSREERGSGQDLLQLLLQKVHTFVPEFRGHLAYRDAYGHEVVLNGDGQLRELLARNEGKKTRLFTTLSGTARSHVAASEFGGTNGGSRSQRGSEPNFLQKALEDVGGGKERKREKKDVKKSASHAPSESESPPPQRLPFIGYGSGHVDFRPIPPSNTPNAPGIGHHQFPATCGCAPGHCCPWPLFIRGSWIGPNKFWGGGYAGGGTYWGGIGQIPSGRYWHTAAGGRPPW